MITKKAHTCFTLTKSFTLFEIRQHLFQLDVKHPTSMSGLSNAFNSFCWYIFISLAILDCR